MTRDLETEVQALTWEQAIGTIFVLVNGEWVHENAVRLAIRTQVRCAPPRGSAEAIIADWFTLPTKLRTKARLSEMLVENVPPTTFNIPHTDRMPVPTAEEVASVLAPDAGEGEV
jgi:hypothetical protein